MEACALFVESPGKQLHGVLLPARARARVCVRVWTAYLLSSLQLKIFVRFSMLGCLCRKLHSCAQVFKESGLQPLLSAYAGVYVIAHKFVGACRALGLPAPRSLPKPLPIVRQAIKEQFSATEEGFLTVASPSGFTQGSLATQSRGGRRALPHGQTT